MKKIFICFIIIFAIIVLVISLISIERLVKKRNMLNLLNEIKAINLALHGYYDCYKKYPPSVVYNDGITIGSWRYLLVPFLEECSQEQITEIRSIPWGNSYYAKIKHRFSFGNHLNHEGLPTTNILAITGPGTIFESEEFDNNP
jgi:Protein of unknown function (DUF1559).